MKPPCRGASGSQDSHVEAARTRVRARGPEGAARLEIRQDHAALALAHVEPL